MEYLYIIVATLISGVVGTGLGGLIGAILNRGSNKVVSLLLSFAAGVMLSVVCFDLMPESFEYVSTLQISSFLQVIIVILSILAGYLIVWGLNILIDKHTDNQIKHIDKDHPQTADDLDELIHSNHYEYHQKDSKKDLFIAGVVMMCAIALHNLPEGMVIGASYAAGAEFNIFSGAGFIMAIVIGFHNIPEGMSVSVPLISGGMKKAKAVLLTALSGLPIVIGAVIGYLVGGLGTIPLVISLGLASGAMLYVILGELIPESVLMWKSKLPALAVFLGIALGFILVIL